MVVDALENIAYLGASLIEAYHERVVDVPVAVGKCREQPTMQGEVRRNGSNCLAVQN